VLNRKEKRPVNNHSPRRRLIHREGFGHNNRGCRRRFGSALIDRDERFMENVPHEDIAPIGKPTEIGARSKYVPESKPPQVRDQVELLSPHGELR
jgi:hypothetical protein